MDSNQFNISVGQTLSKRQHIKYIPDNLCFVKVVMINCQAIVQVPLSCPVLSPIKVQPNPPKKGFGLRDTKITQANMAKIPKETFMFIYQP